MWIIVAYYMIICDAKQVVYLDCEGSVNSYSSLAIHR